jgi:hypothetical protein
MDAQQNDELYPIAVLIDELKVPSAPLPVTSVMVINAPSSTTMFFSD